jgi:hypothetical protein
MVVARPLQADAGHRQSRESRSASATGAAVDWRKNPAKQPSWANKRGGADFVPSCSKDFLESVSLAGLCLNC